MLSHHSIPLLDALGHNNLLVSHFCTSTIFGNAQRPPMGGVVLEILYPQKLAWGRGRE